MTKLKTTAMAAAICLMIGVIASQVVFAGPEQGETPTAEKPAPEWVKLYADEAWYQESNEKEQIYTGILQAHQEPGGAGILMRAHYYKLNERLLYPGKKHPELEKLIGQKVEIRGKPYDIELEGKALSEIWPAAVRPIAPGGNAPAPPRRATPVKIGGVANPRAPKVIVLFENDVDAPKELARLEKLYGFKSANVYSMPTFKGFAAELPAGALEKIRWEPSIRMIEQDGVAGIN